MCGLIAYLGKGLEANNHHLSSMLDQIEHRGPDGRSEVFIENCAYFGHVRLAVIDIDNAKQLWYLNVVDIYWFIMAKYIII